jgi:hypothetical protein
MLLLWMALQLIALALAAGRVPLSARFPSPVERQATAEMLVVQITAAALLFPLLLREWTSFLRAAAGAAMMLALAALMGRESMAAICSAGGYVLVWLLVLKVVRELLSKERALQIGVACIVLWTLGGPILLYMHAEFNGKQNLWPTHPDNWSASIAGGPVWSVLYRLWNPAIFAFPDVPLLLLLTVELLFLFRSFFPRQHITHKLSTKN